MILMRVLNEGQSEVFHILCFGTDCLFRQIEFNQMYVQGKWRRASIENVKYVNIANINVLNNLLMNVK